MTKFTFFNKLFFTLFTLLTFAFGNVWGQNYQESKWWSVYDTNEHTGDAANISGVTICSYSAFAPNAGTFSFDSKLPGKAQSDKQKSNSDPKQYEVEDYQIKFGNKTIDVSQNVSATSTRSGSGSFFSPYRWTFNYTYNYRHIDGSGLNKELTTINADYIYKLANASISIVPLVTGVVYVQNVKVPMATHIRLKSQSNTNGVEEQTFNAFADTYWGTTCGTHQTIRLRSFLTTTGDNKITFTSSNPTVFRVGSADNTGTFVYEVGTNAFACESYSSVSGALNAQSYSCNVYFCPPDVGDYSADITISNGTSSVVVHVSGKGIPRNVNIATQPTVKAIEYLSLLGTSTISNDGVAKDASDASTTVAGAFTWKTPTQQIQATAGTHAYTMVFTPNDKTHYNVKEFNRDLTVQLKTSTITMSDEGHAKVHVAGLNDSSNEWKIDLDDLIVSKMEDALAASRAGAVTYEVTSANKAKSSIGTGNIFSATECGTYTIVATQAATSYYAKATDEFVVTVDRLTPTITSTNRTIKVDSIVANAFTINDAQNISTDIKIKSISFINNGDGQVIEYDIANNRIIAHNAGVAEIYLEQASTDYIEYGKSAIYTITVEKRSNEIKTSYKWKDNNNATDWTRSLGFEDGAYVQFRSNNMEAGAPSIIVRQIEGEDVATFFPDSVTNDVNGDAFYTSFTVGTARWKVSQPENYKYYAAAERQFNLNVGESDCNCVLKQETWESSFAESVENIGTWDFGGVGETLSFELRSNYAAGNHMTYTLITDGHEEDPVKLKAESEFYFASVGNIALGEGEHNTTGVIFAKSSATSIGTDNPYVHNIVVTRKRWMKLKATSDATATISSLAKLQRKVGTAEKTATFYVDFSTCSDKVKVASNHSNVTFDDGSTKTTISTNTTGKTGYSAIVPVTIHYSSDTIESKTVTITVYTEDKNATLTIPVQTTGIETELVYVGNASYPVNSANIAATSLFEVREKGTTTVVTGAAITIAKSGVSDAANVVENALEPLCGNKTINLTASFAGDNRHEPSSLATPQAITIDKIADAVSFNSHPVVIIGKSYDISAWASAHTALTFESGDDDIFSIDGTTLRAHKVGNTTLKATAAGNECTYLSGAFNTESITVQPGYIFNGNNDNQWEEESNWENGEKPTIDDDVIIRGNLVIDEEVEVKSLTIENSGNVTLTVNGSLTVGSGNSIEDLPGGYGNLHVENGGEVNLTTGQLNVNNFTLDANLGVTNENVTTPSTSGQVKNENMLNVSGDAYFRLALDPSGRASFGWYDFVVPFPVDVIGGISIAEDPTAVMKFNVNYAVMAYDEAKNAQRGKHWNKFSGTMQPGRAYTITLDDDYPWNTVVFKKKAGADVTGNRTFTTEYSGLGAETQYNGWNGLGNGTLHHAELDVPANAVIQLYDHTHKCYQPRAAKDYSLAVGLAFFMQFNGVQMVTLQNADGNAEFRAPRRAMNDVENFRLALTAEDAVNPADYIWVSASEDATGEYVIGRDVTKMGTISESTVARMWTQRSGMTLCSNEMPLVDDIAQCELGLYAPQARTYTIAIEEAPEDADLYLTYNGQIIWNLTAGAYTIDLAKGTTSGYGLRVEARAPQITTGVENTTIDGKSARKVLINNIIYIVTPEGEMYDLMGKSVK